jgi:hypothetical protein
MVIAIVLILNSSGTLSWLMMKDIDYFLVFALVNLFYFMFGYLFGFNTGKPFSNLLSFGLIALVGFIGWFFCLIIYLLSDKSPSLFGPEIIWLLSLGYNFPIIYILKLIKIDSLGGFFPIILLVFNLYQTILLWVGLQTRIFIMSRTHPFP